MVSPLHAPKRVSETGGDCVENTIMQLCKSMMSVCLLFHCIKVSFPIHLLLTWRQNLSACPIHEDDKIMYFVTTTITKKKKEEEFRLRSRPSLKDPWRDSQLAASGWLQTSKYRPYTGCSTPSCRPRGSRGSVPAAGGGPRDSAKVTLDREKLREPRSPGLHRRAIPVPPREETTAPPQ